MRNSILLVIIFLAISGSVLKAQDCNESFPYQFCGADGKLHTLCSNRPCSGPNPAWPGGPWTALHMSAIPNCISLDDDFNFTGEHISIPHHQLDPFGDVTNTFDPSAGQTDANNALQQWLGLCHGSEEGSCCIRVDLVTDVSDLEGQDALGTRAFTDQIANSSTCELDCNAMTIKVNYTDDYRLKINNPTDDDWPDSDDPTVGYFDYYNGTTPPDLGDGYNAYSFYQLMEHEIGHFFGLDEADQDGENGSCGHGGMVMSRGVGADNEPPLDLTDEDKCYFEQLYCPSLCSLGVLVPKGSPSGSMSLSVFPNPATNSVRIDFNILNRDYVGLKMFDILGNPIAIVSDGEQDAGHYSESLDISTLPSGSYFCVLTTGNTTKTVRLKIKR